MVRRLSWGGAALLGLALVVFLQQSGRANGPLKRMGDAARAVHSVHLIGWNCELRPEVAAAVKQGRTQIGFNEVVPRRFEAWIQGGRWREDQDFDATVYERGRVWRNGVISSGENTPPLLTSFAYRAITGEDPFGKGVDYTSRVLDEKVMDGRPVTRLLVESKKAALPDGTHPIDEQRLFWLDSQSYLPIRMEEMRYDQDRWALDAVIWFDYDVRVSDKLFDPAAARAERHGAVDMTQHPAKDFYRLTDEQHARYMAIMGAPDTEKARIEADPQLSRAQKDALLVAHSQQFLDRIRKFLDPDQRRLFDDWWYIQPRILDKLATPAQRAEEAKWRAEQQKQMNEWLATFDPETRKRLAGGNQGSAGVVQP